MRRQLERDSGSRSRGLDGTERVGYGPSELRGAARTSRFCTGFPIAVITRAVAASSAPCRLELLTETTTIASERSRRDADGTRWTSARYECAPSAQMAPLMRYLPTSPLSVTRRPIVVLGDRWPIQGRPVG